MSSARRNVASARRSNSISSIRNVRVQLLVVGDELVVLDACERSAVWWDASVDRHAEDMGEVLQQRSGGQRMLEVRQSSAARRRVARRGYPGVLHVTCSAPISPVIPW